MRKHAIFLVLACLAFAGIAQAHPKGNPERGREQASGCAFCHGIPGTDRVYPSYHIPKVGGQHAAYIVKALEEYKDGKRDYPTMHAQASELTRQQMWNIAAFFQAAGKHPPGPAQSHKRQR